MIRHFSIQIYLCMCTKPSCSADSRCFWGHIPIVAAWAEPLCMYPGIIQGMQKVWGKTKALFVTQKLCRAAPNKRSVKHWHGALGHG